MNTEKASHLQKITILFDVAWDTYKLHFSKLLRINVIPLIIISTLISYLDVLDGFEHIGDHLQFLDFANVLALILGVSFVIVCVSALNYIAQIRTLDVSQTVGAVQESEVDTDHEVEASLVRSVDKKEENSLFDIYTNSVKFMIPYIWVMLLVVLFVSFGLLFLIIPGIIIAILVAFSSFIVVTGKGRGIAVLKKSRQYVKGIWFDVFVRFLVVGLLGILLSIALELSQNIMVGFFSTDTAVVEIMDFLYQLIIAPYFLVYGYELYKDVVHANEMVDLNS
jgi:hypothetical protein